ncbi:MAG: VCBS repeat-containing protein [Verrucomicrobia bacterium]|nr:VCBS repeat-containing protein [Verrucomicrobiota bacterium]
MGAGRGIPSQPSGEGRGEGHWIGTLPTGTRLEFGVSESARVQDASTGRVFRWCLERIIDTHGNVIVYSYRSLPGDHDLNQIYCAGIVYGPGAPPWENFHFVVFTYEDRPDWFEDGRSGFLVRTGKRLKEVVIGTQGPVLAGHLAGDFNGDGKTDYLVRKYQLDYLRYAGADSHWSLLAKVLQVGADGDTTLPPATFDYAVCHPPDMLSAEGNEIGGLNEPPFVMDNELVDLVDLNGDGLPDILKTESSGGAHTGFLNSGEVLAAEGQAIKWSEATEVASIDGLAWNVNLQSSADIAHLADMDGDGIADLTYKAAAGDTFYFANLAQSAWGKRQAMSIQDFAPPAPFGGTDVRTADIDFDKRIDIIESIAVGDGADYRIWFNLGQQRYSRSSTAPQTAGVMFSLPGVHIADFNGDRVPDIVRVRPTTIVVTVGLGYGNFAAPVMVTIPDPGLDDTQMPKARLQDITGDGLADLVLERAEPGQLWYWLNLGNYTFSPRKIINGMPTGLGLAPAIRWADLNGNGTTDLVYADSQSAPRLRTIDLGELLGCVPGPNILTRISNGIGRVTTIEYAPSTRFALEDGAASQPWPDVMPFPVSVVSAVITSDSLGHSYVTRFRYHNAYYDGGEKEFRGFARVEQIEVGDATAPTLVTRSHFDTGRNFEAMKGRLLRLTTEPEDGKAFWDETTAWTTPPRTLRTGVNGQPVVYAHPTGRTRAVKELGQGVERSLESEFAYDDYGNQTLTADFGIVEGNDRSAFNDERFTRTEFALNPAAWLIRSPKRQELQDEAGAVISRTEWFYDDETFAGDNFGVVTIGNQTLRRDWIDPGKPDAFVQTSRAKYDRFGNTVFLLDPLAVAPGGAVDLTKGHARTLEYDERFHAYPVREIIQVGGSTASLVFQASYDEGFGVVTLSTDFNGHQTSYGYDALARLIRIVRPGDTPEFPTAEYAYALAIPFAADGLVNYVESRQRDQSETRNPKSEMYLVSRQFVDGLGRNLMSKQEAEPAPGTSTPRVAVTGAALFNARMQAARVINPFFSLQRGSTLDDLLAFENIEASDWKGAFHEDGELRELPLAAAHKVETVYDALGRAVQTTNPDGTRRRTGFEPLLTKAYDENDSDPTSPHFDTPLVHHTDGLGRQIRTDEVVRLNDDGTPAGEPRTWATRFDYDLNDRLTRITDSQGNVKLMQYDGLQRATFADDPDRGRSRYRYDEASNLIETTDAKNQRITFTYDGANRILTEDYHDEGEPFSFKHVFDPSLPISPATRPDVAFFYDEPQPDLDQGDGSTATARNTRARLAYVWDLSGEEHTSYDERGRVEWVVKRVRDPIHGQLVAFRTAFAYDALDRVTRLAYPDGDEVTYDYNDRSLLRRIPGGPSGAIIDDVAYAPSGQQIQIAYGNGVRTTYDYDARARLARLFTQHAARNTELLHFTYDFDNASNIEAILDRRPESVAPAGDPRRNTQRFAYDDLYRLTRVQYSFSLPSSSPSPLRNLGVAAPRESAALSFGKQVAALSRDAATVSRFTGNPEALSNDGEINYRYDRLGNMLAQTSTIDHQENGLPLVNLGEMDSGGTAGRFNRVGRVPTDPPGPHALTRVSNLESQISNREYSYDANGNMLDLDGLRCTWDFKDRLVAVGNDQMRAEYVYDYTDRRIRKRVFPKDTGGARSTASQPSSPSRIPHREEAVGSAPTSVLYVNKFFEVRDHEQPTKFVWNGETRVARVTGSLAANERIQRLRVYPGWNLVSLAVSSFDTAAQLRARASPDASLIQSVHQWNPETKDYTELNGSEDLAAGTVLWLKTSAAGTVSLKGTYVRPTTLPVGKGGGYYPSAGFDPLRVSDALPVDVVAWAFDAEVQRWHARLSADLATPPELPEFLAPGEALFVHASAPASLESPNPNLRIRYYHQDHLGSSSYLSDAQGNFVEESAFYPFGAPRTNHRQTSVGEPYGFSQKENDRETDLSYFEARYLRAGLGRFLAADPFLSGISSLTEPLKKKPLVNPQRLNPYAYVLNNPMKFTDPFGTDNEGKVLRMVTRKEARQAEEVKAINARLMEQLDKINNPQLSSEAKEAYARQFRFDARPKPDVGRASVSSTKPGDPPPRSPALAFEPTPDPNKELFRSQMESMEKVRTVPGYGIGATGAIVAGKDPSNAEDLAAIDAAGEVVAHGFRGAQMGTPPLRSSERSGVNVVHSDQIPVFREAPIARSQSYPVRPGFVTPWDPTPWD